jgi:hypothetical protein
MRTVKVCFTRDMFTPAQRLTLFEAMRAWTEAAQRLGADIRFVDAGDSDGLIHCKECLTVTPSDCDLEVVRGVYQNHRQLAIRVPLKPLLSAE